MHETHFVPFYGTKWQVRQRLPLIKPFQWFD